MAEAILNDAGSTIAKTSTAAVVAGEVQQMSDGRAGVFSGLADVASGVRTDYLTSGKYIVPKASGAAILDGGPVYWDHSANVATYKSVSDRDFYLGTAVGDWPGAAVFMAVNLNVRPQYKVDLARDGFASVTVGTPAAGGFGYPVHLGGSAVLELTATSEAQKVDMLGVEGFAIGSNWVAEGAFRVISDGATGSQDFSIGVASGTHASDFETVAEFVALHLDGNATAITAESDDGTTDVAPTDTLTTYSEGSALANRVEFWIDGRDPTSVKVYVNGAQVLTGTTFTLAAASGPLFPIAHLEKSSGTDTYKVSVDWLRVRTSQD